MSAIQRHNVFVNQTIPATGRFTQSLNCNNFHPDEVKIKSVAFYLTGATVGAFSLHADLGSTPMTCLGPSTTFNGIIVPLSTWTSQSFNFEVRRDGVLTTALTGGSLNIHLEFRRYARDEMKLLRI